MSRPAETSRVIRNPSVSQLSHWGLRQWFALPWIFGLTFLLFRFLFSLETVTQMGPLLFLSGLVILGVPHGAADWWVAQQSLPKQWFPFRFFVVYLVVVVLIILAWPLAPGLALVLFVGLTAWHWGSAELCLHPCTGCLVWKVAQSFARGGWVMFAPFAAHPDLTLGLLETWAMGLPVALPRTIFVGGFLFCLALDFVGAWRWGHGSRARYPYLFETASLGLAAWLLPPLWWVTLYFLGFHSWRHLLRLQWTATRGEQVGSMLSLATLRFAPIVGLSLILGLVVVVMRGDVVRWDPAAWSGSFVVLLAALTVPHAILIGWWERGMEYRRGRGSFSR